MSADVPLTLAPRICREAMIEWCSRREMTHALTLMPNRKNISCDLLKSMFGTFCRETDIFMSGSKHVHRRFTAERFHAIAFPEMLLGNPHLHCAVNFSRTHWQNRLNRPWEQELPVIWKRITRGPGELRLTERHSDFWGRYITKEWYRHEHDYHLAADFHPAARVKNEKLEAVLALLK